jgi:hypothetical protein
MWLAMLEKSNLTTIDMEMLKGDLAGVFKTDKHKKKYVKSVDGLIAKFRKKVKKFVEGKKTWGTYAEEQEGEEEGEDIIK